MRICIPSETDGGIDAPLCPHFGNAPWFTVVDTGTGEVEVLANPNRYHEHGKCHPVGAIAGAAVGSVAVTGIGANAVRRLTDAGIVVYLTHAPTVLDVLVQARAGELREVDPAEACSGGGMHGVHHHNAG